MQRWEPRPSGAAAVAAASLTRNTSARRIGWKWDDLAVSAGLCWRCRFRSNSAQLVPESPPQFWRNRHTAPKTERCFARA